MTGIWRRGRDRQWGAGFLVILAAVLVLVEGCGGGGSDAEYVDPTAEHLQEDTTPDPQVLPNAPPGGDPPGEVGPVSEPLLQELPPPESDPRPEPDLQVETALTVLPSTIEPGESARVEVRGAADAAEVLVMVEEHVASLVQIKGDEEIWLGYVSVTPLAEEGSHPLTVELLDGAGEVLDSLEGAFEVALPPPPPAPDPDGGDMVDDGSPAVDDPVEAIALPPEVLALLTPENARIDDMVRFEVHSNVSGPPRWSGPWIRPVDGIDDSPFGQLRSFNGGPPTDWHHGHDFIVAQAMPIWAAAAGTVAFAGSLPLHGNGVIIDHGAGVFSGYWHMSEVNVVAGVEVIGGVEIGLVGSTGVSTGPHLHWEVVVNGQDVDPVQWLESELHL